MSKRKKELTESAHWRIDVDEDEPELGPFWRGAGADDMDESVFDFGEPLIMNPRHFPPGTCVVVSEPWDEEFYAKLAQQEQPEPTDAEVSADLEAAGIDMTEPNKRLREMVDRSVEANAALAAIRSTPHNGKMYQSDDVDYLLALAETQGRGLGAINPQWFRDQARLVKGTLDEIEQLKSALAWIKTDLSYRPPEEVNSVLCRRIIARIDKALETTAEKYK